MLLSRTLWRGLVIDRFWKHAALDRFQDAGVHGGDRRQHDNGDYRNGIYPLVDWLWHCACRRGRRRMDGPNTGALQGRYWRSTKKVIRKEHHRWFFVSGMPGSPLDNVLGRLVWSCFVWRCPGRTCGSGRRRSRSIAVHLPVSLWTVWFRARLSVIIDRAGKRLQWRTGDPTEAKLLMATNVHEHAGAAFWLLNTPNPYPAIFRPDASGNQVSSHQYFPASQFSRLQTFP